jgi:hypothetical protein
VTPSNGPNRSDRSRGGAKLIALAILVSGCGGESEIDQPAPLYGEVPIEYPLQLWDEDMEGETLLRVRVTDTGQVDSVEVMESRPDTLGAY